MRNLGVPLFLLIGLAAAVAAQMPAPQGFVTDLAGVIDPPTKTKLTSLLEELKEKTGAEIAVLTVDSTAPLDDFTYAMQVADAWKPGKKGEDTGALVLVAVKDRKIRVLTGYGVEGILPDGLVGEIQDREMLPEFRAGRIGEGIWRGVAALANRIAAERGVVLTGVPPPRPAPGAQSPMPSCAAAHRPRSDSARPRGEFGSQSGRGPMILPVGFGGVAVVGWYSGLRRRRGRFPAASVAVDSAWSRQELGEDDARPAISNRQSCDGMFSLVTGYRSGFFQRRDDATILVGGCAAPLSGCGQPMVR